MDRCICKRNYVNYVKINMPYDICFYLRAIFDKRLYINNLYLFLKQIVDTNFKLWYNFSYSIKYQLNKDEENYAK